MDCSVQILKLMWKWSFYALETGFYPSRQDGFLANKMPSLVCRGADRGFTQRSEKSGSQSPGRECRSLPTQTYYTPLGPGSLSHASRLTLGGSRTSDRHDPYW